VESRAPVCSSNPSQSINWTVLTVAEPTRAMSETGTLSPSTAAQQPRQLWEGRADPKRNAVEGLDLTPKRAWAAFARPRELIFFPLQLEANGPSRLLRPPGQVDYFMGRH